jgi:hypothetical protein
MTRTRLLGPAILLGLLVAPAGHAAAQTPSSAQAALAWLRGQQGADGGFSNGFATGSDLGATADAVIAIVAGGQSPEGWSTGGATPLDFLVANAARADNAGLAAKVALALIASGKDPRHAGQDDLIAVIGKGLDPTSGLYGAGAFDTSLAILALHAAGEPVLPEAVRGLVGVRLDDGSYAFDASREPGSGDSNTTAVAVMALVSAGAGDEIGDSLAYFRSTQNTDGGWTYQKPSAFGEATDANSTALVTQALVASGENLESWGDPIAALESLQQPDGALAFNAETPGDNLLATIQAVPALAGVGPADLPAAATSEAPGGGNAAIGIAAALILLLVLGVAGIVGRSEG